MLFLILKQRNFLFARRINLSDLNFIIIVGSVRETVVKHISELWVKN